MRKHILIISAFIIVGTAFAQDKLLTIQEAVLKGRTSLAPKRLQSLGFIPNHDQFSYINDWFTGIATCFIKTFYSKKCSNTLVS